MTSRGTRLEYTVLGDTPRTVDLAPGTTWTFGRGEHCSARLALPELSRMSLVLQAVEPGVVRVISRQSNRGIVVIASDDGLERHVTALGSAPVHLTAGNYSLKVELPPVVLEGSLAVPFPEGRPGTSTNPRPGARVDQRTASTWSPEPGAPEGREWIAVAALAVTLARFPDLADSLREPGGGPVRMSEALRRAVAAWCGHSSLYWVNERLKEGVDAAGLTVAEGGERLSAVVGHYEQFFSDATIRTVRQRLLELWGT